MCSELCAIILLGALSVLYVGWAIWWEQHDREGRIAQDGAGGFWVQDTRYGLLGREHIDVAGPYASKRRALEVLKAHRDMKRQQQLLDQRR